MTRCEGFTAVNTPAPRPGCDCRSCYREREAMIRPLAGVLYPVERDDLLMSGTSGPMGAVLNRWLQLYCSGKIGRDEMLLALVRDLVSTGEELFKDLLHVKALQPILVPRGTPEAAKIE